MLCLNCFFLFVCVSIALSFNSWSISYTRKYPCSYNKNSKSLQCAGSSLFSHFIASPFLNELMLMHGFPPLPTAHAVPLLPLPRNSSLTLMAHSSGKEDLESPSSFKMMAPWSPCHHWSPLKHTQNPLPLGWIPPPSFCYHLWQDIEYNSLCSTVGTCCLSILYIIVCTY